MTTRQQTRALWTLAIAAAAAISFRGIYEPDLWWHLAQGRYDAGGHLVRTNIFSFIWPDYRQTYTGWAGDVGIYLIWKVAGFGGIQAAQAAWLLLTFWLTWMACRERAPRTAALSVLIIGFFVIEPRAIPRPHLVSFAGIAACAWIIERARASGSAKPLVWAAPVIAIWSNLHVESLFGAAFIGAFVAGELVWPSALPRSESRRAIAAAALAAAATIVNPYGVGIVRYLAENALVPQLLNIAELQPPYLPNYRAFFAFTVIGALLLLWQYRTLALWELLTCAGFGAIAFQNLRFTPMLFLVTAPMVAGRLGRVIEAGIDGRALVATALAGGLVVSRQPVAAIPRQVAIGERALAPAGFFSPGAIAFARAAGLNGPVFNSQNLGGFLAWTLYPATTVFQDTRLQSYPPEHFRAILDARDQSSWDALVAGVDWAVLSLPRPNELSGVGRFPQSEWATVFRDAAVEIVVRRQSRFAGIATTSPAPAVSPAVPAARP